MTRLTLVSTLVTAALIGVAPGSASAQPSGPMSVPPPGIAASEQIPILREVGIDQKLNDQVPLDLEFSDEEGRTVRLGEYFGSRPVVLALVYYECPMLCTQILNGLTGSLEALSFNPGDEFEVVVVSFDPGETPAMAAETRKTYLRRYSRPGYEAGWHFLTGREASIKTLADAVGFRYAYDEAIDQYAHPASITVLTEEGRVSKYAPRDLRLALVEAADGRIGTAVDQALLFCYHYDPETGKYGLVVMNLVRTGGVLTLLALGAFIVLTLRRERRAAQHANG
jgi:protein SCO1/2